MATILITGGNRGIGLELSRQWAARGDEVIVACRHPGRALEALGVRIVDGVDVSSESGVAGLTEALGDEKLDVLFNNAGILLRDTLDELDFDALRRQYEVNSLGPLRVTRALLGRLGPGSKVAIMSSRVGSVGDNESGGNYGYRMSKAAVNMAGANLAIDLARRDIAVALLHPGMVATEMTRGTGIPPERAAEGLIRRVDELSLETTGRFWHAEGYELPW